MPKAIRLTCFLLGLLLPVCAVPWSLKAGGDKAGGQDVATDPFAYCAAVMTADEPAAPYAGPAIPPKIVTGIRRAVGLAATAPEDWIARGARWRCMDGSVVACFVGANLPCDEKADLRRTSTSAMRAFCEANPNADAIPISTTGRATVFQWRCRNDAPAIVRQIAHPDASGYIAEIWHKIEPDR